MDPDPLGRIGTIDRRLGASLRETAARAGLQPALALAGRGLAPAFRGLVAIWLARPATRRMGAEALMAATAGALAARTLRDRIGRRRPGRRPEGGFPSRHAAAAAAIAGARGGTGAGAAVAGAALVGLVGRVAAGEHEPLDILAGGALGLAAWRLARVAAGLARGADGR